MLHFINEQVLYWLSGLTCTDENFVIKSGAQRVASSEGIALVAPDTSPSKHIFGTNVLKTSLIKFLPPYVIIFGYYCFFFIGNLFHCEFK